MGTEFYLVAYEWIFKDIEARGQKHVYTVQWEIFAVCLQSPQQKFSWVLIFAFQCQETTPTNSFACENTGAWEFIPVLIFALTTLPSKNAKFCTHENFPLYGTQIY